MAACSRTSICDDAQGVCGVGYQLADGARALRSTQCNGEYELAAFTISAREIFKTKYAIHHYG